MDNAKIFAVVAGETHEGHTVRGVFTSLEVATLAGEHLVARWNGPDADYTLETDPIHSTKRWDTKDLEVVKKRWNDGGYYLEVVEWPLDAFLFGCDVDAE
jgi:hypothetical protein